MRESACLEPLKSYKKKSLAACAARLGLKEMVSLPAVSGSTGDLIAATRSAGYFFKIIVPCVIYGDEEFEAVDLRWIEADTNVSEERLIVAVSQRVVLLAAPFVVDAELHGLARRPNRAERDAVVGIVERVEARVDGVVTIVLVFVQKSVAGNRLDGVPALGGDQFDADGFDVDGVGGSGK